MKNSFFSNHLNQLLEFLHQRKPLTIFLILVYAAAILISHDFFVQISVKVMLSMGLENYNRLISGIAGISFLTLFIFIVSEFFKNEGNKISKIVFLSTIIISLIFHYFFLLEMNIEIIHAFAYSPLVFLFFCYFKRFAASIIFAIPIMLIDEYYQYQILYTYVEYWELNDVLLDILGGLFGLAILHISNIHLKAPKTPFYFLPEFVFLVATLTLFIILTYTGYFSIHHSLNENHTIFEMSRIENPYQFWHIHTYTKAKYHILSFLEAAIIFSTIGFILIFFDRKFIDKNINA
jgi:hypothetical protein